MARRKPKPPRLSDDPRWFQTSTFYEVMVRSFYDSNDDGMGDFRGLTEKLDYLQWLGVDCLWLVPFYSSPLRDGGYDISDYYNVLPEYGTIGDVAEFLEEAHHRSIRVIVDLVVNHTSDQHPWFQESRQDKTNPKADWYVWDDDPTRWSEARVIFVDTEPSNWTWDPVREQYYWHRFFSHQPDLNFDNPEVQEAMLEVLRFWLDLGLDGFRLDAVPYLFERDGTNGENLKETHEFLKRLRKEIDAGYPNKVLLAEANQWPADVVEYFGDTGDECQMCFHFPVMPRMFMAARREQRTPITEILAQTPAIPDGCQWGIFLRNHDELTLEMVTDDERDYMYGEYAKDPRMKLNLGIRRRLFPLLDNNERLVELFHGLLFSLPGSPILYYGDEIGMGDNIYLGDRDGVRTPMQWSPDRNGGFSKTDFERMFLPPIMDPVYGFQVVNVESQLRDPSSFLHWTQRMIEVRKQHAQVFGLGTFEVIHCENPSVLAFVRQFTDPTTGERDVVLCTNNLSRFAQPAELHMATFEGLVPHELLGRVTFPRIGELPYFITLPPHGFFWFQLCADGEGLVMRIDEETLEEHLRSELPSQRWFGARSVDSVEVAREIDGKLVQVIVRGNDGGRYQTIVGVRDDGLIVDATTDHDLSIALFQQVMPTEEVSKVRPLGAEQTNTSLVFDERLVLKIFRRLTDGPNPDVEVTRALADVGFEHVIPPVGLWRDGDDDYAVVNTLLTSSSDGWHLAMTSLRDLYDRRCAPEECPGDFGFEAERLGAVTAQMHVAMADAFGTEEADVETWLQDLEAQLARIDLSPAVARRARAVYATLVDDPAGPAIRIHGDLHLGQTLRDDLGWFVLDFEGEPARPLDERRAASSPMRDVAGMMRSFDYAAQVALRENGGGDDPELRALAAAWERHNAERFLAGYEGYEEIDRVLPPVEARHAVRRAFELDKAVYEVAYEAGHRPDWVDIPMAAVLRLASVA